MSPGLGLIVPGRLLIFRAISGQSQPVIGGNVYPFPEKLTVWVADPMPGHTGARNNPPRPQMGGVRHAMSS
jgi:hypothetical protein